MIFAGLDGQNSRISLARRGRSPPLAPSADAYDYWLVHALRNELLRGMNILNHLAIFRIYDVHVSRMCCKYMHSTTSGLSVQVHRTAA